MTPLPTGTLTFVFTDVAGSTRLWEADDAGMREAMRRHDALVELATTEHEGRVVRPRGEGDSRFLVFEDPIGAVLAAVRIQRDLGDEQWALPSPLSVRLAIHTGTGQLRDGDYYGTAVNRCARIRGVAHPGQILLSDATRALIRDSLPPALTTIDLGEHRLRDLTRPERIHQLAGDGLASGFPPLSSLSAVPNNLPAQGSDFVGRARELSAICELLSGRRMVTIVAPGGTGKTRLALQAAAELATTRRDGAFLVELAPVSGPDQVPLAIAEALDIPLAGDEEVVEQLVSFLRAKELLLVLDNFEHVLAAGRLVPALLDEAPDLTVLVTSRSQVGVSHETVFHLGGLDTSQDSGVGIESSDGARLFVETATRRLSTFVLADSDLPALAEILERTQGSPLAILLAATWIDVLSIAEIAAELRSSLDLLEAEMSDLPERHRSVRAVFEYSWAMLDEQERSLFARLSLFRGGFTREAASRVAGASLRDLSRLARQSLITPDPDRARYTVHELLREFGEERLDSSEGAATEATEAYVRHFDDVLREVADLSTSGRQREGLAMMEAELDNLRASWRLAIRRGIPVSPTFITTLWFWHEVNGGFRPAIELFTEAVDLLEDSPRPEHQRIAALARAARGWFLGLLGDTTAGAEDGLLATEALAGIGDPDDLAFSANCRNMSLISRGDAALLVEETTDVAHRFVGSPRAWWGMMCDAWTSHGLSALGDHDRAVALLEEVRPIYEALGEQYTLIWVYEALANIAKAEEDFERARGHYLQVLDVAEALGHDRSIHYTLNNLGQISDAAGDPRGAIGFYVRSLAISHELGQRADVAANLHDIAGSLLASGDRPGAVEILAVLTPTEIGTLQRRYAPTTIAEAASALLGELPADEPGIEGALRRGRERGLSGTIRRLTSSPPAP